MAPVEDLTLLDLDRSNKGASKQRRDQINAEINVLRDLLPLPESSRQRLSQLQVMSLSCVYIRKCNILQKIFRPQSQEAHLPDSLDFFQAMTGFLLVTTREGKLIYISENVTDYLGHSMVDMKTQGDSLYDIIDKRDHAIVQTKLSHGGSSRDPGGDVSEDISFFCRMNMSRTLKRQSGFGDVKVMHIQGHFVPTTTNSDVCLGNAHHQTQQQQYVFMASCSPLMTPDLKENLVLNNTMVFKTVHSLDMTFLEVTKMAEHHLGSTSDELCKSSWYNMIHPEDIREATEKHMQLVRSNHQEIGCMMTVRMMKADGTLFWVNIVMHVKQTLLSQSDEPYIVCINQIISTEEAYQIKVQGQMFSMYPSRVQELWGSHMPPSISSSQPFNNVAGPNQQIQQEGSNSVPVPSYPCSMPNNFPSQYRYPVMYPSNIPSMMEADNRIRNPCTRNTIQSNVPNLVQTDKLKAMLKRKIQGPQTQGHGHSRQAKVPKMVWDLDAGRERPVYHELESASPYRKGEETQHPIGQQGQVVQVMLATTMHQPTGVFVSKPMTYQSPSEMMTTDVTSSSLSPRVKVEQVVPDIYVPESYLTPDPSPISSPEPSSMVKTEVMDPDEPRQSGTSSVSILQALEKLASQPQERVQPKSPQLPASQTTKVGKLATGEKLKNRELPIFNAFEIDRFFEMLDIPVSFGSSKASFQMEDIKKEQDTASDRNGAKKGSRMPPLKKEEELDFVGMPSLETCTAAGQIPHCMVPAMELPALVPVKTEMMDAAYLSSCHQTSGRKDMVVTSTMVHSPLSVSSQDTLNRTESLDDLLNSFSEDAIAPSPFGTDCSDSSLDQSFYKSPRKDDFRSKKTSSFDSLYQVPAYPAGQRALEELSPQSTFSTSSSCLSRDDDLMDNSWIFGMELDNLDAKDDCLGSPRNLEATVTTKPQQEDVGMDNVFDQVSILLNSLVTSQGSLDM